ncbi:MAG: c-type cytochrome [Bdellovibrionales bacterium]
MKLITLFISIIYLVSCTCSGGKNRTDSEYMLDMMKQRSIKAQEGTDEGKMLMRLPPEGTRARNRSYYPFPKKPLAADQLKNPVKLTPEVFSKGQKHYEKYCIYCHGTSGDAQQGATVAPKMVIKPLSLLTDKARSYSDGRIYHIIYNGQGLMGSYRAQLTTSDQVSMSHYIKGQGEPRYKGSENIWALVHYVRSLQRN